MTCSACCNIGVLKKRSMFSYLAVELHPIYVPEVGRKQRKKNKEINRHQ